MGLSHDSDLSERVIGLAIEVHRQLGPGLLESAYEECLPFELKSCGIDYSRQVPLPIIYRMFAWIAATEWTLLSSAR
jgi:GxxExxY protein